MTPEVAASLLNDISDIKVKLALIKLEIEDFPKSKRIGIEMLIKDIKEILDS